MRTLLVALLLPAIVASADEKASGDCGGARSRLAGAGIEIEIGYTAESFGRNAAEDFSYLGNLDVMLTFDTEKLGAWPGG